MKKKNLIICVLMLLFVTCCSGTKGQKQEPIKQSIEEKIKKEFSNYRFNNWDDPSDFICVIAIEQYDTINGTRVARMLDHISKIKEIPKSKKAEFNDLKDRLLKDKMDLVAFKIKYRKKCEDGRLRIGNYYALIYDKKRIKIKENELSFDDMSKVYKDFFIFASNL